MNIRVSSLNNEMIGWKKIISMKNLYIELYNNLSNIFPQIGRSDIEW